MIALARLLVRLLTLLSLIVLSAAGILVAVFSISGGRGGPSLTQGAKDAHLPELRDTTAHWLGQIEAHGSIAVIAGLCGLGAIVLGLVLLAGLLVPRRERLITLERREGGTIAARRRALAQVATALVDQLSGVASARVRIRPRRTSGARLAVRATRTRRSDAAQVKASVRERLANLTEPFKLTARVEVARRTERVS
ncbi:MAG: hypothetical protein JO321_10535 [Solirubrobacterales bacterium]|nr:hypothetical protein [Solirubrobacterales bacterium]